jgi:hypothetical protein
MLCASAWLGMAKFTVADSHKRKIFSAKCPKRGRRKPLAAGFYNHSTAVSNVNTNKNYISPTADVLLPAQEFMITTSTSSITAINIIPASSIANIVSNINKNPVSQHSQNGGVRSHSDRRPTLSQLSVGKENIDNSMPAVDEILQEEDIDNTVSSSSASASASSKYKRKRVKSVDDMSEMDDKINKTASNTSSDQSISHPPSIAPISFNESVNDDISLPMSIVEDVDILNDQFPTPNCQVSRVAVISVQSLSTSQSPEKEQRKFLKEVDHMGKTTLRDVKNAIAHAVKHMFPRVATDDITPDVLCKLYSSNESNHNE